MGKVSMPNDLAKLPNRRGGGGLDRTLIFRGDWLERGGDIFEGGGGGGGGGRFGGEGGV